MHIQVDGREQENKKQRIYYGYRPCLSVSRRKRKKKNRVQACMRLASGKQMKLLNEGDSWVLHVQTNDGTERGRRCPLTHLIRCT